MVCMYVNLKIAVLLFNLRIQILRIKIQINFIHLYMQRSSFCEGVLSRFMSCFQSLMTQPFEARSGRLRYLIGEVNGGGPIL